MQTKPNRSIYRGLPVVLSGPSGSGKGCVVKELLANDPTFALSVSVTTRSPRPGEIDGVHYHFITDAQFAEMERTDALLEHAGYVGHYYGTPAAFVEQCTTEGRNVILEIEVQGALQIRARRPDTVLIFLVPPDAETLEARLRGRGTESEETVRRRMEQAREECRMAQQYDYVVVNEEGGCREAAEMVSAIVRAEQCRIARRAAFVADYFNK